MRAGKFDRLILIEQASPADDGYNETEAWATLAKVPAQYIPSAGREAREQMGREAQLPATFRIPWAPNLAAITAGGFRVRYPAEPGGQVWDIKSAVEIGRRQGIEIIALARGGAVA
jgi:head-tail adaptor